MTMPVTRIKVVESVKECVKHDPPFEVLAGEQSEYSEVPERAERVWSYLRRFGAGGGRGRSERGGEGEEGMEEEATVDHELLADWELVESSTSQVNAAPTSSLLRYDFVRATDHGPRPVLACHSRAYVRYLRTAFEEWTRLGCEPKVRRKRWDTLIVSFVYCGALGLISWVLLSLPLAGIYHP
jgi:hypothetical protein